MNETGNIPPEEDISAAAKQMALNAASALGKLHLSGWTCFASFLNCCWTCFLSVVSSNPSTCKAINLFQRTCIMCRQELPSMFAFAFRKVKNLAWCHSLCCACLRMERIRRRRCTAAELAALSSSAMLAAYFPCSARA